MALQLQKTLIKKKYTLYIEVLYVGLQKTDKETGEKTESVRMNIYESKEHRVVGFSPMLKRWEDIPGDADHVVPFKYSKNEEYDEFLRYIHQYVIDHLGWYRGATLVEPLDMSEKIADHQTQTVTHQEPVEEHTDTP